MVLNLCQYYCIIVSRGIEKLKREEMGCGTKLHAFIEFAILYGMVYGAPKQLQVVTSNTMTSVYCTKIYNNERSGNSLRITKVAKEHKTSVCC